MGETAGHILVVGASSGIGRAVAKRFSVLNTGAILGHDAEIGDNTTISPAAFIGGRCTIGGHSLVVPLAKVLQGVKVRERAIIGVGCTVLRSVADGATIWPKPDNPLAASDQA